MSIAIFSCWIDYQTIPMLSSFITSLAKRQVHVDLYTIGHPEPQANPHCTIKQFRKFLFNNLSPYVILVRSFRNLRRGNYHSLIAVDAHMILASLLAAKVLNIKAVYMSLEIYVEKDINNIYHRLYYWQQRFLLRFFDEVLIMDQERKNLLLLNSSINTRLTSFLFLPNAPLGRAKMFRSQFLQDRLGVAHSQKILLCPGEIAPINSSFQLWEMSRALTGDWVMVLHSRKRTNPSKVIEACQETKNFRLSLKPVEAHELRLLYGSAHIGLVIYTPSSGGVGAENVRRIGKASGKLAHFLQVGVPVIMSDQTYFRAIAEKYHCGVCITDLLQLPATIESIERDYQNHVDGCIKCFEEELNFDNAFDAYISSGDSISSSRVSVV